jgi:hypothetical protein
MKCAFHASGVADIDFKSIELELSILMKVVSERSGYLGA